MPFDATPNTTRLNRQLLITDLRMNPEGWNFGYYCTCAVDRARRLGLISDQEAPQYPGRYDAMARALGITSEDAHAIFHGGWGGIYGKVLRRSVTAAMVADAIENLP